MPAGETMASLQDGLYAIDPLRDDRWPELMVRYPNASVFHTRGWLGRQRARQSRRGMLTQ